jgi:signal transduction histidine kinase
MTSEIGYNSLFRVLAVGFTMVIILLITAGAIGLTNAHSIQAGAAALVKQQLTMTRLIEELEREQDALNAVFYKLSRAPDQVDRERILLELDRADQNIAATVSEASGWAEIEMWRDLRRASLQFSTEARRLLELKNVPTYSSRDLFRRHEEVTSVIARVINSGYQRALTTERTMDAQFARLVRQSLILLSCCLIAALVSAIVTVRLTARLFRRMEWQANELSRVSWRLLDDQETIARRLSHELHDELGQALTAVKANLRALESNGAFEPARVEDCRRLVDDAMRNVRELSQLLRPTILDDFGLDASIRSMADRFTQRTGIEVDYVSQFSGRLPQETETHLFRIVQEALTNVARHSGASRVNISLRPERGRLCLSFVDNGRGIEPLSDRVASGNGMTGMRARARSSGGGMGIKSRPGEGLQIEVWVPLASVEPPHDTPDREFARR